MRVGKAMNNRGQRINGYHAAKINKLYLLPSQTASNMLITLYINVYHPKLYLYG